MVRQRVYKTDDYGLTWDLLFEFPSALDNAGMAGGNYAVNFHNENQVLAARQDHASSSYYSGQFIYLGLHSDAGWTWLNKGGNWLSIFGDTWAGGDVIITSPFLVRRDNPVSPGMVAGDDWDHSTMLALPGYRTHAFVGAPVDTVTGHYVYSATDFTIQAQGQPLSFHRTYSSKRLEWETTLNPELEPWRKQTPVLGPGWTHNFNIRLLFDNTQTGNPSPVIFQLANGSSAEFRYDATEGKYVAEPGLIASLNYEADFTWTVELTPDHTRYRFNASGRLTQIDRTRTLEGSTQPRNSVTLSYENEEIKIIQSGGTYLHFDYGYETGDPMRLKSICVGHDPNPCTPATAQADNLPYIQYDYGQSCPADPATCLLKTATDSLARSWSYTYRGDAPLLESVKDPLNIVAESQVFETSGQADCLTNKPWLCRVKSQTLAANQLQLDYTTQPGKTLVTYNNENQTSYSFGNIQLRYGGLDWSQYTSFDPVANYQIYHTGSSAQKYDRVVVGSSTRYQWQPTGLRLDYQERYGADENIVLRHTYQYGASSATTDNRVTNLQDPRMGSSAAVYDNSDFVWFPTRITAPDGTEARYTYDDQGRATIVTTAKDGTSTSVGLCYYTDPVKEGLVWKQVENLQGSDPCGVSGGEEQNRVTTFDYDNAGRVNHVTDPQGRVTTYAYNQAGQPVEVIRNVAEGSSQPDHNLKTEYRYDGAGRLEYLIESRNNALVSEPPQTTLEVHITRYTYDGYGRQESVTVNYVDGVFNLNELDKDLITRFAYDSVGNRTMVESPVGMGSIRRDWTCYDALNRPVATVLNSADTSFPFNSACLYTGSAPIPSANHVSQARYDFDGNVFWQTDAKGNQTWSCYDLSNRLTRSITNPADFMGTPYPDFGQTSYLDFCSANETDLAGWRTQGTPDQNLIQVFQYDKNGNQIGATDPVGNITWTCYDPNNRPMLSVQNSKVAAYPFSQNGNCAAPNNLGSESDKDLLTEVTYDPLGRIAYTQSPMGRGSWTGYDGAGRIQFEVVNPAFAPLRPLPTPPSSDRNLRMGYTYQNQSAYTPNGSMMWIEDPWGRTTEINNDALDRPIRVINNVDAVVKGDPTANLTNLIEYDIWGNVIREVDPSGAV
ncbi:MAG: RHS repeat protein, partial [Anaerolineae bacterium]|nr:RHS repeat protein [Anaerolineae bacterium]